MRVSGIKRIWGLVTAILFLLLLPAAGGEGSDYSPAVAGQALAREGHGDELSAEELKSGRYFYMIDERGRTILITGRRLGVKDRFLNADNELYEVESVKGNLARARFVERVELNTGWGCSPGGEGASPAAQEIKPAYRIAIYHTHNAECYVPSDGTESVYGTGGIHEVGLAFKESLEKKGVKVLYSDQLHLPHDRGAYRRSRGTALRLLREHPDAIFDLHRDAAPWEKYALELQGEELTQIQIVVGLSNPGVATNQQFAYDLKGYADRIYPGLIHGVLLIWGSYNQDLSPLALLLEVGAHTNTKEAAERGIARFADVVSYYFYGPAFLKDRKIAPRERAAQEPPADRPRYGIMRAFSGTILSLLLVSTGASLGFYFLNSPDALERLYLWIEALPERLARLRRRSRLFWGNLPGLLKNLRRAAPFNLSVAWHRLGRERAILPWIRRELIFTVRWWAKKGLAEAAALWREAPQNLRRAWEVLRSEKEELPRVLRKEFSFLEKALRRLSDRFSAVIDESRGRLRFALMEARSEIAVIARLLREYTLQLRNRLRP